MSKSADPAGPVDCCVSRQRLQNEYAQGKLDMPEPAAPQEQQGLALEP